MRFLFVILLTIFVSNIGIAQIAETGESDSTITIHMTPEDSYIDSTLVNYVGVWSQGFEENKFTPCGNWVPDSLGGVAFIPNRIGIADGKKVWDFVIKVHPDTLSFVTERPKNATYDLFIEARGWLIGPGTYDHFGTNHYTIKTTQFKEVRWAMPNECEE